ncbi:MFS transporter [Paenibacillus riograndensis]|uniref:Putative efflux transporter n=1 Tax=Paenibacillus riograndensis SBR5 TaxID=1073571 RepID=A0A0E4CUI8_9BACL|nr:MFS transporter [Paenibacillus riograndensis]CQR52236.1 putative efflux transporter [Paenibacillus riograndensis SBR5]
MKENQENVTTAVKLTSNKPFVLLITAQLVSNIGDWLHILALLTMVGLKWQASPWEITAVSLCMAVPMLLGGPFAGYLSDKVDRKGIMIGSDLVRAGIVACLVFAGSLWQVYVLLLAKGVMDVLFSPAKSGKLKELVPPGQMDQAVALSSSIEQITKIIGPALGGLLVAAVGISACYFIDSVSYIASAVILLGLPRVGMFKTGRPNEDGDTARPSFRKEAGAGLRLIGSMPVVLSGVVMIVAALLVLQIADSQTVTLFREIPGVNADLLGWCVAASGFGTLLSALAVGRLGSGKHPLVFMGTGTLLMGSVFAGAALVTVTGQAGFWMDTMLFGSFVLAGVGAGFVIIPFNSMLQRRTPEAYTGRVFGIVGSLTSAAVILGPVAGGALVTASGPATAFLVSGVLSALLGAAVLFLRTGIENRDQAAQELQQSAA